MSLLPPKITIITPTYGQGQYIEQTIQSVLDQGYQNLEYIIMDGGSKDGTVDIIKKYEKHLSYWESRPDKGQSDAINKGLKKATGNVVNWLNSDDYYEPHCLQTIAQHFENPNTNVVCGRSNLFTNDGTIVNESQGTDIYSNNLAKTIGQARIDQPETFFRKSALDVIGLVDQNFHYVMDKEWWIRYLIYFGLNNIKQIDEKLVNFRLHEESKTVSQKDLFGEETASIYYNLAKSLQQDSIAQTIDKTEENLNKNLKLNIPDKLVKEKKELLLDVLQYYLLERSDYFYSIDERVLSANYLTIINKVQLSDEDNERLTKLRLRNKFLPKWIKNLR